MVNMMTVEARPASAGPPRAVPVQDPRRPLSADAEPRTLAARKAYPEEEDSPLDLSVRKEISVCDFARRSFADPADFVRAQVILRQSREYLVAAAAAASGRDSGTDSDDFDGRLSPGEDPNTGKAYKKSLMKRYSKSFQISKRFAASVCGFFQAVNTRYPTYAFFELIDMTCDVIALAFKSIFHLRNFDINSLVFHFSRYHYFFL